MSTPWSLADLPLVGGPDLPIGVFWPPHPYETTPERYQELAAAGMTFVVTGNYLFDQHINRRALELVGHAFSLPDIDRVQVWHDAANAASGAVPKRLGFTQVDRRTPPRDPLTPGEVGIDVIWQLDRPE